MNKTLITADCGQINGRQIAFFAAFVLPIYKLVETPSLLAGFVQGDLLLPALAHFLVEATLIFSLLFLLSKSEKSLLERLIDSLGDWVKWVYGALCICFLTVAVLPLLDLEKFVYAVFYDTAPTAFFFAFFFLFAVFFCTKGIRALGRIADLSLFLFLIPFLCLIGMSLVETEFSTLLPFFEKEFGDTMYAMTYTKPHFLDTILLFPLLMNLRFQKGDGIKIASGYSIGAAITILFFAVFYGLYSSIAPREHYAFAKIAQYYPVLSVVGRIDLLFVYLLCVTLFYYTTLPLQYTVHFLSGIYPLRTKNVYAVAVCLAALVFTLFCNQYYNSIYAFFGNQLSPIFYLIDFAPLATFLLLIFEHRARKKEKTYA